MAIAAEGVCKERCCENGGGSASNFGSSYDCGSGSGYSSGRYNGGLGR